MRQKKYVLRPLELWDPSAAQRWLEDEAAHGWYLTDCGTRLAKLERRKPAACRVRIQPCKPEPEERWKERFAAYEAMGWVFASSLTPDFEVFYCDDPSAPELDTDPVAWGWAWKKPLRRARWDGLLCLLCLMLLLAAPPLFLDDTPLEFLLSMPLRLMAGYPLALLLAAHGVRGLLAVRKARRALAAGLTPEFRGDWRRSRRRWYLLAALVVVYWLTYALGDIAWRTLADADGIDPPIVSVTALVPDSGPEDWSLDLSHYSWSHTPLRPAHGELLRGGSGDRWVLTTGDSLCFSGLAGPLYRERLAAQRRLWPAAVETAVQDLRFDEAVLLEDGDSSYFLARRGRAVTSAQVDFPLDLTAHLDDFAAVLGGA